MGEPIDYSQLDANNLPSTPAAPPEKQNPLKGLLSNYFQGVAARVTGTLTPEERRQRDFNNAITKQKADTDEGYRQALAEYNSGRNSTTVEAAKLKLQGMMTKAQTDAAKQGLKFNDDGSLEPIPEDQLSATQKADLNKKRLDGVLAQSKSDYQKALLDFQSAPNQVKLQALQLQAKRVAAAQSIANSVAQRTQADLYGTDLQGNALPGAPQVDGQTVGLKTAANPMLQKGLKAWGEVGDSVARLEQMKRLASEAATSPNPGAADMALLFNHMAMTGGNVSGMRMGEQITQDHMRARGIPEEIGLLYNKLASGAQLSPEQRQNFVKLGEDQVLSKLTKGEVVGGMYGVGNAPASVAEAAARATGGKSKTAARTTGTKSAADYLKKF
jgi:hypothetical protein